MDGVIADDKHFVAERRNMQNIYIGKKAFFFQAEDGIRDWSVTGVQTCALPISACDKPTQPVAGRVGLSHADGQPVLLPLRSEERRVGKECISRRLSYHAKKEPFENRFQEARKQGHTPWFK